jgi:hypothetical protein
MARLATENSWSMPDSNIHLLLRQLSSLINLILAILTVSVSVLVSSDYNPPLLFLISLQPSHPLSLPPLSSKRFISLFYQLLSPMQQIERRVTLKSLNTAWFMTSCLVMALCCAPSISTARLFRS